MGAPCTLGYLLVTSTAVIASSAMDTHSDRWSCQAFSEKQHMLIKCYLLGLYGRIDTTTLPLNTPADLHGMFVSYLW